MSLPVFTVGSEIVEGQLRRSLFISSAAGRFFSVAQKYCDKNKFRLKVQEKTCPQVKSAAFVRPAPPRLHVSNNAENYAQGKKKRCSMHTHNSQYASLRVRVDVKEKLDSLALHTGFQRHKNASRSSGKLEPRTSSRIT